MREEYLQWLHEDNISPSLRHINPSICTRPGIAKMVKDNETVIEYATSITLSDSTI